MGMKAGFGAFRDVLLDKPNVIDEPFCAICGRPARDKHHIIQKGMGGVTNEIDAHIPFMRLCGDGNGSGCHGKLHEKLLHIYWDGGYVFMFTAKPMDDMTCWERYRTAYLPVPGWVKQEQTELHVYGSRKKEK